MELILVDTVRGGGLTNVIGAAYKYKLVGGAVFLRVKQVGTIEMLFSGRGG
jgi:hypothetical protein